MILKHLFFPEKEIFIGPGNQAQIPQFSAIRVSKNFYTNFLSILDEITFVSPTLSRIVEFIRFLVRKPQPLRLSQIHHIKLIWYDLRPNGGLWLELTALTGLETITFQEPGYVYGRFKHTHRIDTQWIGWVGSTGLDFWWVARAARKDPWGIIRLGNGYTDDDDRRWDTPQAIEELEKAFRLAIK
jgi:hypothetical protein